MPLGFASRLIVKKDARNSEPCVLFYNQPAREACQRLFIRQFVKRTGVSVSYTRRRMVSL